MTEIFCRILAQSRVFQDFLVHTKVPFENKPTVGHGWVKYVKTTLDLWKKILQIRNMIFDRYDFARQLEKLAIYNILPDISTILPDNYTNLPDISTILPDNNENLPDNF